MIWDRVPDGSLYLSILSGEQVLSIHLASLEILERTGLFIEHPAALEMLRDAGARVDGNRVRIPSHLVDRVLRSAPKRVVIADRDGNRCMFLEGNRVYYRASYDCRLILDPYTHSRRPFVSADYRMTVAAVDSSPHIQGGGCAGNASDYPPEVRQQIGFKLSLPLTMKPFVMAPLNAQQVADIYEMAEVVAGSRQRLESAPFVITTCEPTSPLGIFRDATEILLLAAQRMMPVIWYGMPAAGSTAPASRAGTLAIGNAEVLAGLVIHQLERPGAPFIYGMMPSMMDMRSTQWTYGSPDFALQLAAATGLAHSYGLPMYGTAGCTDAVDLDAQAVTEATLLFLMGQLSGANLIHDLGLMAGNQFVSPEMIVLCQELIEMTDHATRRIDTSGPELAVDLIDEVGPQGNYLALDHTLQNFRRFWHSNIFLRNRLTGSEEDDGETVGERISRRTREIIKDHQAKPLTDDVARELDELEKKWMSRVRD